MEITPLGIQNRGDPTLYQKGIKGFSIVELIFVVLILSLLAAIAIPQFVAYRTRAYNVSTSMAVRQAYTAAEAFSVITRGISVNDLSAYGYDPKLSIILTIGGAKMITNFTIQAVHGGGGSTFTVDERGDITRS